MSIEITKKGKQNYAYFYPGRNKKIYLGPIDNPEKINSQKVLESLSYVTEKNNHYSEIEQQLVSYLPLLEKNQYLSNRLIELDSYSDKKLISSLSEDARTKYLEKRTAELQTRLRQIIPMEINPNALTPLSPSDIDKMFELEEPTPHTVYEIFDALWLWYIDKKKSGETLFIEFTTLQIIIKHSRYTLMKYLKEMEKQKLIKIRQDPATRIELKDRINELFSERIGKTINMASKIIQERNSETITKQTKNKKTN
ncbi:hypothetical protein [Nitrosarchaeum sp. AC2]|uniref:hypothetical protein n=1 Tax=Nitrosarchaeum sp. AC2 TaxID=2259673 RepID=UPI0015CBBF17|nr:hypothetical protein [Nitrosarchaeum sp. AC2]QLH11233.1 hypothetical protein DSQ20_07010 [Nitrosarchaeum sp. AC2]